MRASMVGTTIAWVTPSARTRFTQSAGSKFGSCTMRRPAYTELKIAAMPATW